MIKNNFSILTVLIIAAASFTAGVLVNNVISTAGLSVPFLTQTTPSINTCINQKCVAVEDKCSTDSNCITHMECNGKKQCVSVSGPGDKKCSTDIDCDPMKDPQKWCEANNSGTGLKVRAIKYPNGNFSCDCYYANKDGSRSMAACSNSHLQ